MDRNIYLSLRNFLTVIENILLEEEKKAKFMSLPNFNLY